MLDGIRSKLTHPFHSFGDPHRSAQRQADRYESGLHAMEHVGGTRAAVAAAVLGVNGLGAHAKAALYKSAFFAALSPGHVPAALVLAKIGLEAADKIVATSAGRQNSHFSGPRVDEQTILVGTAEKMFDIDRDNWGRGSVALIAGGSFAVPAVQIARARAVLETLLAKPNESTSRLLGEAGLKTLQNPMIDNDDDRLVAVGRHVDHLRHAKDNPALAGLVQAAQERNLPVSTRLAHYITVLETAAHS